VSAVVSTSASTADAARARKRRRVLHLKLACLVVPGVILLLVGLVWPFASMLGISFQDRFPNPESLTGKYYLQFVEEPYLLNVALRTFALAIVVTVLTILIGYPVAWYLARSNSRWKHLVFLGVVSPLLVSIVVRTIGWTIILGNEGLINSLLIALGLVVEPLRLMQSFWSVVLGMTHVLLPFMVLSIASVVGKIDGSVLEAAEVLGAPPWRRLTQVILPLSVQGIASGSVIVFCLTIGAYITPLWLGRGKVTVMSVAIYDQMMVIVDWPQGAAASMILTVATLIVLTAYGLFLKRHAQR
jgi:putative spermidine/putrescine transport system permease protein